MITFEALDVILRVQNLPGFMARMRAGAKSVRGIGTAAVSTNKKVSAAVYAAAKKATLGLTAMAAVATATGYKQSVEFEKQLTLVHTQAGATVAEMKAFKQPLLDLAKTLPQGPIELAKGLYHIKSIGIPAAQALDALKIAAQGAMVGNADLEQTTSALGAAWLAGIKGASGFRNTMAIMNATVGAGNMRMDELVTALGTGVLPTAKLAGLGIQDVMAALALLKDEGYGAYGAMAQFATALHFFSSPTKKATDAFAKLGLRQLDLADIMRKRGMVAALEVLRERLHLTGEEMARLSKTNWAPETQQEKLLGAILPGGRGRVFRVLLNQVDRYQMKIDQINRTSKNFSGAIADTQKTAAAKLHIAWSSIQVDLIRLGDTIRGPATDALVWAMGLFDKFLNILIGIPGFIRSVSNAWRGLPLPIRMTIETIGVFLSMFALIRGATVALAITRAAWVSLRLTIMAVRGAMILLFMGGGGWMMLIMLAVAAIVVMILHWKETKKAIADVWNYIKGHDWAKVLLAISAVLAVLVAQFYAVAAATAAWGIITGIAEAVYAGLLLIGAGFEALQVMMGPIGWILIGIGLLIVLLVTHWGWVKQAGVDAWHWIKQAAIDAWNWIKNAAIDAFHWVVKNWKLLPALLIPGFGLLVTGILLKWDAIKSGIKAVIDAVKGTIRGFVGWLQRTFNAIGNNKVFKFMSRFSAPALIVRGVKAVAGGGHKGGYTGGLVTAGGMMDVGEHGRERIYLPGGSFVQPAGFRSMPGGAKTRAGHDTIDLHNHIYLDGKEIAENTSKHMANKKARK